MAKTTTFGAVNTALVQGAGAAYKDYSTDSFNKANINKYAIGMNLYVI